VIARTQRTWWKNFVTYNMFYHLEHHLFPAVPTIKLPELAKRIDATLPEIEKRQTF
jgi:fatty acid desaturase